MRGLMMDRPLLIGALIQYAAEYHGDTEIVARTTEGPIHRYTYLEAEGRAQDGPQYGGERRHGQDVLGPDDHPAEHVAA